MLFTVESCLMTVDCLSVTGKFFFERRKREKLNEGWFVHVKWQACNDELYAPNFPTHPLLLLWVPFLLYFRGSINHSIKPYPLAIMFGLLFFLVEKGIKVKFDSTVLAGFYLLKVSNRNTRSRCQICPKLTIKTPERRHWGRHCRRSGVFIVNFKHISHFVLEFLLLTLSR